MSQWHEDFLWKLPADRNIINYRYFINLVWHSHFDFFSGNALYMAACPSTPFIFLDLCFVVSTVTCYHKPAAVTGVYCGLCWNNRRKPVVWHSVFLGVWKLGAESMPCPSLRATSSVQKIIFYSCVIMVYKGILLPHYIQYKLICKWITC